MNGGSTIAVNFHWGKIMSKDEVVALITARLDDHESEALLISSISAIVLALLSGVVGAISVLFCLGMI